MPGLPGGGGSSSPAHFPSHLCLTANPGTFPFAGLALALRLPPPGTINFISSADPEPLTSFTVGRLCLLNLSGAPKGGLNPVLDVSTREAPAQLSSCRAGPCSPLCQARQ